MYLTMFKASEDAVNLLLQAQRECEEIYISSPEADIKVLDLEPPVPAGKRVSLGEAVSRRLTDEGNGLGL